MDLIAEREGERALVEIKATTRPLHGNDVRKFLNTAIAAKTRMADTGYQAILVVLGGLTPIAGASIEDARALPDTPEIRVFQVDENGRIRNTLNN